jgi:hypothetical protein
VDQNYELCKEVQRVSGTEEWLCANHCNEYTQDRTNVGPHLRSSRFLFCVVPSFFSPVIEMPDLSQEQQKKNTIIFNDN